jgi:hypothetical protein
MPAPVDVTNRTSAEQRAFEAGFHKLADQWEQETLLLSSNSRIREHLAFAAIVRMGHEAIPLLLAKLKNPSINWFIALSAIVGDSPVSKAHAGSMQQMAADWLAWGKEHG